MVLAARWVRLPESLPDNNLLPHVSLIIPAHNEELVLREKLLNALSLNYPQDRLEIIVASDGSTDATASIAREFADRGVRLLAFEERRGKALVLNDAIAASKGDVLMLCDANVFFEKDALRWLVAGLANPRVGAVTGDVRLQSEHSSFGLGESLYYKLERAMQLGESVAGSVMGVDGGMYIMRRNLSFHHVHPVHQWT